MDRDVREVIEEIHQDLWIDATNMNDLLKDYTDVYGVPYEELKDLYDSVLQAEKRFKDFLSIHPKERRKRRKQ